jgi:L-amino acid N-acyltransferase YncA
MVHAIPTQRIHIRSARPDDGAAFASIYAPFVNDSAVSFEEKAPSAREMTDRILAITRTYPWLALERYGEVIGYAYGRLFRERAAYRWTVETTIYLRQDARGLGFGTALYARLIDVLVERGYQTAMAGITLPNDASVALHRSCGYVPAGILRHVGYKQGAWHDVAWWQRPLARDEAPRLPRL